MPRTHAVDAHLRVEPQGEQPFEVRKRIRIPEDTPREPGTRLAVIYDPDDHELMILDPDSWQGSKPRRLSDRPDRSTEAEVSLDEIVALCKRRGFIFPSSEIYGGLGSTYDYGHYGVLLRNNVKNEWWRAMLTDRDDIVAIDSAILQHPKVWEASGHLEGFTDPLIDCKTCKLRFRADHIDDGRVRREALEEAGRGPELRAHRGAPVQPHVRDPRRPGRRRGLGRLPAPRDRAGHLHQLQERAPVRAQEAAVRDRPDRQVVPQRDHDRQLRLPDARVRADGDGVLRARPTRPRSGTSTGSSERMRWYTEPRHPARPPAPARPRRRRALPLLAAPPPTSSTCSRWASPSSRGSPTAATSTSPSTRSLAARSSSTSTRRPRSATSRT